MLRKEQKLVIHFYEQIDKLNGKMGHGILRYSENPIACVIDFNQGGKTTRDLFEFGPDVPVVSNVEQALGYGGEVLVLGMAPSGGRLPESMIAEVEQALAAGMCVVNGLHERISDRYADLRAGQWMGHS